MDRIKYIRGVWLALIIMISVMVWPAAVFADENKPINYVFLISVGGLNQEGYAGNPLPNLRYLSLEGTYFERSLAVRSDTMEAAEATLLTGALAKDHKHLTVNDSVEVESILDVLKKNNRSLLVVDGSGGKLNSFAYGDKEYRKLDAKAPSQQVFEEAFKSFSQNKPFFSYIYFDDCTDALLRLDQDEYYKVIRKFDEQLGVFVTRLRDAGVFANSLIVVTSARSTSSSNTVPLIIAGPGLKVNATMSGGMVIDVAPTICKLVGLDAPAASRGIPLYSALAVKEEDKPALYTSWIKDLQKDRQTNWSMNYSLEDELNRTVRQMNSIKEEKQSIFDFAGEREQLLIGLRSKITLERIIWIGIVLVMLGGYVGEYVFLKRKFLLFK
jgi:Arylsulfatase A and related enzymes